MLRLNEIASVTMTLFAIIDVLGAIPVIIGLKQKAGKIEPGKASIAALLLMTVFLFTGEKALGLVGIDISSFAVAGSILIFLIAMEMISGMVIFKDDSFDTVSIVPIAFPLIAGAGTMTTLLTLKSEFNIYNILIGILINIVVIYVVLKSTTQIERKLGKKGVTILRKSFGLILLAMAIKIFKTHMPL